MMTEAYTTLENTIKYYNYGSHIPSNFNFIANATNTSDATTFKNIIEDWMKAIPKGGVANWVVNKRYSHLLHNFVSSHNNTKISWKLFNLITCRKTLLLKFFSLIEKS